MKKRTITKRAKTLFAIVTTLVLLTIIAPKNSYEMQGIITDRDTIIDQTGHIWEYDTNDFNIGDKVIITFHDRGTTNRTDDTIKEIK